MAARIAALKAAQGTDGAEPSTTPAISMRARGGEDDEDADDFINDVFMTLNGLIAMREPDLEVSSDEEEDGEDPDAPSGNDALFEEDQARGASPFTSAQAAFAIGKVFQEGLVHNNVGDKLLKIISKMLPEGNTCPRCDRGACACAMNDMRADAKQNSCSCCWRCTRTRTNASRAPVEAVGMRLPPRRIKHACRLTVHTQLATAFATVFRSMYLLKKSLGVRAAADFEFHMCPNQHCCAIFEPLARKDWERNRNAVCQECLVGRRFRDVNSVTPVPSKRCGADRERVHFCSRFGERQRGIEHVDLQPQPWPPSLMTLCDAGAGSSPSAIGCSASWPTLHSPSISSIPGIVQSMIRRRTGAARRFTSSTSQLTSASPRTSTEP